MNYQNYRNYRNCLFDAIDVVLAPQARAPPRGRGTNVCTLGNAFK